MAFEGSVCYNIPFSVFSFPCLPKVLENGTSIPKSYHKVGVLSMPLSDTAIGTGDIVISYVQ